MASRAGKAEELEVQGIPVRLSSPDKIYYPKLGVDGGTKRHLFDYYRAVAEGLGGRDLGGGESGGGESGGGGVAGRGPLLDVLRDRPVYLQRFPDGIEGEEVYQKRAPARRPEHVQSCRVTFPSGRTADALKVTTAADICWASNLGTVTFHPLPVRCPDTDRPDEMRIDLDPQPGTGFDQARRVALDVLAPLLDELVLTGFPKTSGGRGIHVFVPIEPKQEFTIVRRGVIALARELERRAPDAVTSKWWKEERGERIFIDYNQAARDRTMAAAYSARRTPIATVSTPVTWAELEDVHPDDCTIATVPGLLAKRGDPMAGMHANPGSLARLLELADRDAAAGLGEMPYPPNYPKMPGEPPRVPPSKAKDAEHRADG